MWRVPVTEKGGWYAQFAVITTITDLHYVDDDVPSLIQSDQKQSRIGKFMF